MFTLMFKGSFSAAHQLPDHPGKCSNLHGHRWEVEVRIIAYDLDEQGMVVDFHDLKELFESYDHAGGVLEDTAEQLAQGIWQDIANRKREDAKWNMLTVIVEESPGCSVSYVKALP